MLSYKKRFVYKLQVSKAENIMHFVQMLKLVSLTEKNLYKSK